jgi:hypothetical protein
VETNRSQQHDGKSDQLVKFQDQLVTAGVANIMRNVIEGRLRREQEGDTTLMRSRDQTNTHFLFGERNETTRAERQMADQKNKESFKTVERFIGQLNRQSGTANQDVETQLQIVSLMDNATRQTSGSQARFNAADIVLSAKTAEQFQDRNVKRGVQKHDLLQKRDVSETAKRFDSMQVARLNTAKLTSQGDKLSRDLVGEGYKTQSRSQNTLKSAAPAMRNPYTTKEAQHHSTFGTGDRSTGGLKSKFMRDKMETDRTLNAISENN